ncbi:MAG: class I SAM-dependent methyltransferase [Terracidiphilus sp.]
MTRLLRENPTVLIDALDASPAMLRALLRNAGLHAGRVRTHLADARLWQPPAARYDLIATHFFLDCLTTGEVASLAARLRSSVTPSALWVVSEFAVPEGWFGWLVARPLIAGLYLAFRLLTGLRVRRLPNHRQALAQAGFTLARQRHWLGGLLVSELWASNPANAGPDPALPPDLTPNLIPRNVTNVLKSSLKEPPDPPFTTPDPSR